MQIGYAGVSTDDEHLELQFDALEKAGGEQIFTDKNSGTRANRSSLDDALPHIRKGNRFAVWKFDRLGRSAKGLVDRLAERTRAAPNAARKLDGLADGSDK